ncbi:MAG: solute carrier family 8 (sodium/calcium exchanger) [Thermoproteota archaeon]|jgi:solute carrier family 8 (sodium/calcium exchanger)
MQEDENKTWGQLFKDAVVLQPRLNDDGELEEVGGLEATIHFWSIGWKVFFSLVPPKNYNKGKSAFFLSLFFIGCITAVVGEFANLFGCVIGLTPAVTAISFVALGTSLPDTLASKQAAEESPNADSAIGNVTGSNSVNVFLGLGLPWVTATLYYNAQGTVYKVPSGELAFSVGMFLFTSVICIFILIFRRKVSLLLTFR